MPDTPSNQDLDLSFLYEIADGSNEFIIESIDMLLQQTPEQLKNIGDSIFSKTSSLIEIDVPVGDDSTHSSK